MNVVNICWQKIADPIDCFAKTPPFLAAWDTFAALTQMCNNCFDYFAKIPPEEN